MKPPVFNTEVFQTYQIRNEKEKKVKHIKPKVLLHIRRFFNKIHRALPLGNGGRTARYGQPSDSEIHLVSGDTEKKNTKEESVNACTSFISDTPSISHRPTIFQMATIPVDRGRQVSRCKNAYKMEKLFYKKGYKLKHDLGSGSYSKVRLVCRMVDKREFAAKIVDRTKYKSYASKFLPEELATGLKLNHKNIIQYREVIIHPELTIIIMDLAQLGDLLEFVQTNGALQDEEARSMFGQITFAVQYLHHLGFAHRDLKCENILLKADKTPLISDFGFARKMNQHGSTVSDTYCGSAAYASPQLLCGIPYDPIMNDIWSLGCILFIIVCASMPFDESDVKAMVNKQMSHAIAIPNQAAQRIPGDCKTLIRSTLDPNPEQRPKSLDILKSDWLKVTDPLPTNESSSWISNEMISGLLE